MISSWLSREFFRRDPLTCARELIGCELVWQGCAGIIVETEAYAAEGDPACHTFLRASAREFIARQQPGAAYIYLNYGMYWLLNVLIKGGATDGFVLIRALEPTLGIAEMARRRIAAVRKTALVTGEKPDFSPHENEREWSAAELRHLCSGPGKLARALAIDGRDHGRDLCAEEQKAERASTDVQKPSLSPVGFRLGLEQPVVIADLRVGISKAADFPWRFLLAESTYVSVKANAVRPVSRRPKKLG